MEYNNNWRWQSLPLQRGDLLLDGLGSYLGRGAVDVDVDLGADAELGLVDAGFDREGDTGNQAPAVTGFQVIDVDPVAVDRGAD